MALTPEQRQEIITNLTTNCDCWKNPGDRELLTGFRDEKLLALAEDLEHRNQAFAVANAAANGFEEGGRAYRVNPETGKWEYRETAVANDTTADVEDDSDDEGDDDYNPPPKIKKKGMQSNAKADDPPAFQRPRTMDEWLRQAPAEVQNTFKYAQSIEQREKDSIIAKLLVNVAESERPAHRDRLLRRSLDDLYNDLSLVPKMPTPEDISRAAGAGSAGKVTNKRSIINRPGADDEKLEMPTLNWNEVTPGAGGKGGKGNNNQFGQQTQEASQEVVNSGVTLDAADDEWFNNAPPHVRAMIQNAAAIENRERRKLIDEITANIADEDAERRLRQRLANKSIEELKDLAALTPKSSSKTNYFGGSAAPPALPSLNASNPADDVLPLPTMDWTQKTG